MIYTIQNERLRAEISALGAELKRLVSAEGIEYLCPDDRRNWEGSAPVLFPNTGCVRDGFALAGGKPYPYEQHGFARRSVFSAVEQQKDAVTLELRWSEDTLRRYPYRFVLRVCYALAGDTLAVTATVCNEGEEPLYCSLGFHPGFACPLLPCERAEDYRFTFPTPMTASRVTLRDALAAETVPGYWEELSCLAVKEGMFDGGSFTMTDPTCRTVRMESAVSGRFVEVSLGDFPNLVLWAPKDRPITNLCIEPWFGIPDAVDSDHRVEGKAFTVRLAPEQTKELRFSVRVG